MDSKLYKTCYNALTDHEDVLLLSQKYEIPAGVLSTILNQKVVTLVKRSYRQFNEKENEFVACWKAGETFLDLAKKCGYPPTLVMSVILKKNGYNKKQIAAFYKNPTGIQNPRIRSELLEALDADYYFSPRAHKMQEIKGKAGEEIISGWLKLKECEFLCEDEIRASGPGKTPDFVLKKPIRISGHEIHWVESKALFGDMAEHKHYEKNQFLEYSEIYGTGLVVYWFGFISEITENLPDNYHVVDFSFFKEDLGDQVEKLLNYSIYW
ncbi:C15orf41 family protein [Methanolapillus ohkumae]|uniref:TPD domain-containing protein n=1 Tax=Methanolapillus ohkumae TaxID=3028298 RepID=A0AA97A5J5_9EURY|nr:hypothetical protein MsAm2_03060 [Methanosarcinaceae archaeon Am2]